ncbi:DUF3037 domain-containing protein [Variovorax sp. JS1663]|uniref:DUF3037 domain-containing protein n=1 Tax=Variovorax sp. JS1663 TaxID=1851577 RepID=UPI000B346E33|nr:DUF3037 domain-containing protein [Variovorax sp. JS1663]
MNSAHVSELAATTEGPYTYSILRYVHDIGTAEFINVGVVVASCNAPCVAAKFKTSYARVKGAFPSLDAEIFLTRMKRLQACFDAIDAIRYCELRAREGQSVAALIRSVVPLEDSALHWSPAGSGIGGSLAATLPLLYERFVIRHDLRRRR